MPEQALATSRSSWRFLPRLDGHRKPSPEGTRTRRRDDNSRDATLTREYRQDASLNDARTLTRAHLYDANDVPKINKTARAISFLPPRLLSSCSLRFHSLKQIAFNILFSPLFIFSLLFFFFNRSRVIRNKFENERCFASGPLFRLDLHFTVK